MKVVFNTINCIFILLLLTFSSCGKKELQKDTLFQLMEETGISFTNDVHNTKDFNIFTYRNFYNGGGVAIGDINNDGLSDVFFTSNMGRNGLYLNKGSFQFENITDKAGFKNGGKWGTGVVMVDINSDGWLDVYVCNAGFQKGMAQENELYINNKNGTFTEDAKEYGLADAGYTTHAAFFDYDLDGDLDCYILNNSFIPVNTLNYANKRELRAGEWPVADFLKGGGDRLLKNEKGHFVDVSEEAHIYGSLIGFGLGVTVGDVNGDLYPDIYVSNDFFERDYLYINQKNGTYKEDLEQWTQHISHSSMGADIGDINNDGYPDIFTTDMLPDDDYRLKTTTSFENIDVNRLKQQSGFYNQFMQNTLQVNNKGGKFLETGYYSGVAASDWSWGGLIFDANNDGLSDIYVCNGIYHDVTDQDFIDFFANDIIQKMVMTGKKDQVDQIINKMPSKPILNKMFTNEGGLRFKENGVAWGFTQPSFSNGAAYGDLDNDGDLDLVINNVNQKAFVYKNNTSELKKSHYIGITLKGKGDNTFAVGSSIKVFTENEILSREVIPSRGFQSSVDYKNIIGLGNHTDIDSLVITWPDRSFTTIVHPAIDTVHLIDQKSEKEFQFVKPNFFKTLLQAEQASFQKHKEDDYIDFYYERNIPGMQSREGPKAAYADVNGDGLTDVYIGGAKDQAGQLYLQTASGFVEKKVEVFLRFADFEDVSCLFFDANGDTFPDLFVGSGGNNNIPFNRVFQNRLYINDSKGNFQISADALPASGLNNSIAVANDYDGDGDMDLFVGSKSVPQNYGMTPQSFLYENDGGGKFRDVAKSIAPALSKVGMVTGAVWANVYGDKKAELIVVGEWMSPKVFSYTNGRFLEVPSNLQHLYGWWQTVIADDFNGDGKIDLMLGNIGENFYLKPTEKQPVKMWVNDYDKNGTAEKIITRSINGKDVPVFLKRDVTDQVATLRKQNLRYEDFAKKSVQELFDEELINGSEVKQFNYASSCIAFNKGDGTFDVVRLPYMVQLSSVNAAISTDINNDGMTDIILGGNNFGFQPQFSRLDASFGHVLLNRGGGLFNWISSERSGLEIKGEIKDIKKVDGRNGSFLLFLQNNDYPLLYKIGDDNKSKK